MRLFAKAVLATTACTVAVDAKRMWKNKEGQQVTKKTTLTTHTAEHKLAVSMKKIGNMQKKLAQKFEKARSLAKQNKKKHHLVEEVQKKQDLQELQQTMVVTATGSLLELKGDDDDDDRSGPGVARFWYSVLICCGVSAYVYALWYLVEN
ncbi:unnamed protein product [Amoebophrya sp. A120]|nr:unnamed protein product [Amoebophrya sp. A120]|eukprot:GSA120T00015983001.1